MLLENKNAVIYGGGGAIGGVTARILAREGATVYLAGRTRVKMEKVAEDIVTAGGTAEIAEVDALDELAVDEHAADVVRRAGRIDVSFNAVGMDNGDQGVPLIEMSADVFIRPVNEYVRTHFVTARAAARHMSTQGSGVILPLSNPMAGTPAALTGSFGQAAAAVENLTKQLGAELGPTGVRVVCIRPTGMPEGAAEHGSNTREVWSRAAERLGLTFEQLLEMVSAGPTEKPLTLAEVAETVAFAASDRASGMTGTVLNVSRGAVAD